MNSAIRIALLSALTATALLAALPGAAQSSKKAAPTVDIGAFVNTAFRQPMLAERSTKAFMLLSRGVLPAQARRQLDESLAAFDGNLKRLIRSAPTPDIRDNYELLEQLFDEYRVIKSKPNTPQNAALLAEQNEELVWISQKGAQLLLDHAKTERNNLVATAGEARTLTQRLAKLYLFRASGIKNTVIADDLKKAEDDYRLAINKLKAAAQNTDAIKRELELAESQWIFLTEAIRRLNINRAGATELEHVSKACDNIGEVMERLSALYERV